MCIRNTSICKYMTRKIKPKINQNKVTRGFEIFISSMLLQSDLNKFQLRLLIKFDYMFQNSAPIILGQKMKYIYKAYRYEVYIKGFQNNHMK